jgi:hypothetical protein
MSKTVKTRLSILRVQRIVDEFKTSGLSQRSFCKSRNIPAGTLQWYFKRVQRHALSQSQSKDSVSSGFVEIKTDTKTNDLDTPKSEIVIAFPRLQCEIRLNRPVEGSILKNVIEALYSCSI